MATEIKSAKMYAPDSWATHPDRVAECLSCNKKNIIRIPERNVEFIRDLPVAVEIYTGKYYKRHMGWLCDSCGNKYSTCGDLKNESQKSGIDKLPQELIDLIISEH